MLYPKLIGEMYPVVKRPMANTIVQTATSGREVRVANYLYPRWQFDLAYSWLSQEAAYQDLQTMMGFFCARTGSFDSFLFDDVTDDNVTSQFIATGDGTTKAWQMQRTLGTSTRPVYAINGQGGLPAYPSSPAPAFNIYQNGVLKSATDATYGYSIGTLPVIDLVLQSGGQGFTNGTYNLTFTGGLGSGAAGTYTCSGGSVTSLSLSANGSGYAYPPQVLMPLGNGNGAYAYAQVGNGGTLLFKNAPGSGVNITADFWWYWRCRFLDDHYDFENFVNNWWEVKKLTLQETRS